jgi:hypothetical protein
MQLVRAETRYLAGYGVVPWKRGKGYAGSALRQRLPVADSSLILTASPEIAIVAVRSRMPASRPPLHGRQTSGATTLRGLRRIDMAQELQIRCACGKLQGVARDAIAGAGTHVVCYCDDCQAFARILGRAADALDAHGGTDIFQMSQARLAITAGADHLACLRLTPPGMLRWYASCCNTPIGNTLSSSRLPFVGLILACVPKPPGADSLDGLLGPVVARGFRKFASGDVALIPRDRIPMPLLVPRFVGLLLKWKIRGDGRRSPFFDSKGRSSVVTPRVLSASERALWAQDRKPSQEQRP